MAKILGLAHEQLKMTAWLDYNLLPNLTVLHFEAWIGDALFFICTDLLGSTYHQIFFYSALSFPDLRNPISTDFISKREKKVQKIVLLPILAK